MSNVIPYWSFATDAERFPTDRGLGWGVVENGWQHFIDMRIKPLIDGGHRRFELHNPAGRTLIEDDAGKMIFRWPMDFVQFVRARNEQIPNLDHERFVEPWKRLIDETGVEVICYLGSITDDPVMQAAEGDEWDWWAGEAVNAPWEAGMSIAFDRGAKLEQGSREFAFYRYLQSHGVRTYIEPHPMPDATHLHGENVIVTEWHWQNAWKKDETKQKLSGEVVRMNPDGDAADRIVADGHVPMVAGHRL